MHWKQKEVLDYLSEVDQADLSEIYQNVSFYYYYNAHKHLGAMLSRLIKDGRVERVKPGVFRIKKRIPNVKQLNIFD